jgi:Tfp pilus assembly protein PilN
LLLYGIFVVYLYLYGPWLAGEKERALEQFGTDIKKAEALRSSASVFKTRAAVWEDLLADRRSPYGLFNDLGRLMPVDMWLTRVAVGMPETLSSPGVEPGRPQNSAPAAPILTPLKVVIEGGTNSLASVGVYSSKLSELPDFRNVTLKTVQESTGQPPVSVFVIEAELAELDRKSGPQ